MGGDDLKRTHHHYLKLTVFLGLPFGDSVARSSEMGVFIYRQEPQYFLLVLMWPTWPQLAHLRCVVPEVYF